ncbi:MAG: hypothetical protein OHK0022_03330 [Roseiflexaceae bacterium]
MTQEDLARQDDLATYRSPLTTYLRRLSPSSQKTLRPALELVAATLSGGKESAASFRWERITDTEIQQLQERLREIYQPTTVKKIMSAVKGVMHAALHQKHWPTTEWVETEPQSEVADAIHTEQTRGHFINPLAIQSMLHICLQDRSVAGARDAAMIAVLAGAGLDRSELVELKLEHYYKDEPSIFVAKQSHKRTRLIPISKNVAVILDYWVEWRGTDDGPLFVPTGKADQPQTRELDSNTVEKIVSKRAEEAGFKRISPRDFRYTYITTLFSQLQNRERTLELTGLNDMEALYAYIDQPQNSKSEIVDVPLGLQRKRAQGR